MTDTCSYPGWEDLKHILNQARQRFIDRDQWLLEVDSNERSMTHKFAEYLQQLVEPLSVACEYNRDNFDIKKLPNGLRKNVSIEDTDASTVFPDIIVHKRGTDYNLLVIEAKKSRGDQGRDIAKLQAFTAHRGLGSSLTIC